MKKSSEVSYLRSTEQLETTRYPEPADISTVYNATAKALNESTQSMFDAIDDSLFELANNARSNNEQNRFFEAMRDVRIKKQSIEATLQLKFKSLFEPSSVLAVRHEEDEQLDATKDSLSLVSETDMELDIAISSMATKANSNFQGQLIEIQRSFGKLYGAKTPEAVSYPLAPKKICLAFNEACSGLEVDLKERLLILKQFDRYVMGHFDEIVNRAASAFISLGIKPEKRTPVINKTRGNRTSQSNPAGGKATLQTRQRRHSAQADDILPALTALLNQTQSAAQANNLKPQSNYGGDLGSILDTMQNQSVQDISSAKLSHLNLENSVAKQISQQNIGLSQNDSDLINLVSMLFEFILKDYCLAPSIQVLISRLQIPILKVVMHDKSFFNNNSHPARHLLNNLAKAGIGWSESQDKAKDPLYQTIHQVVYRVLNEFDGDVLLFQELNNELTLFLTQEERKAALIEQRTREAEAGRIRSRRAQTKVEETLSKQILSAHHSIPELIINVLKNGWSRVMFLAYLKDAEEHQWQNTVEISKELIWCLQPLSQPKDRQRWITIVPKLLKDIEAGLRNVSFNTSNLDETMEELKSALTTTFKESSYTQAPPTKGKALYPREKTKSPQGKVETETHSENPDYAAYLNQVSKLKEGQWVEFKLQNGNALRCRLSAHIKEADSYIFVNRMGLKPIEKTREELAKDLKFKRAIFLDQGLIIDRALSSIMTNLRQGPSRQP